MEAELTRQMEAELNRRVEVDLNRQMQFFLFFHGVAIRSKNNVEKIEVFTG